MNNTEKQKTYQQVAAHIRALIAGETDEIAVLATVAAELRHAQHYEALLRAAHDLYMQGGDNILTALKRFDTARYARPNSSTSKCRCCQF